MRSFYQLVYFTIYKTIQVNDFFMNEPWLFISEGICPFHLKAKFMGIKLFIVFLCYYLIPVYSLDLIPFIPDFGNFSPIFLAKSD